MAIKSMIRFEQVNPKAEDFNVASSTAVVSSPADQVELMRNISKVLEDRFGLAYNPQNGTQKLGHTFADDKITAGSALLHIPFMFDSGDSTDVVMGHLGASISMHSAGNTDIEVEAGQVLTLRADDANSDELVILDNGNNRLQFQSKIGTDDASSADDNASILMKSTLGGVKIAAPAAKDLYAEAGQLSFASLDDAAEAIKLHANQGSSETIVVKATQSTVDGAYGAGAIQLEAAAGGMSLKWADGMSLHAEGGDMYFVANEDIADAIKLHADAGTSQTIQVLNDEGTAEAAIKLLSSAGGIDIDGAAGKDIDIASGQVKLYSKDDVDQAILLETADAHTNAQIEINGRSSTRIDAVYIHSTGGWDSDFSKRISFTAGNGGTAESTAANVVNGAGSPVGYGLNTFISTLVGSEGFVDNTIWLDDKNSDTTWAAGYGLPLSVATDEWTEFKNAFGEVSLLGALVLAGAGAADAGTYQIEMTGAVAADDFLLVEGASGAEYSNATVSNGEMVSLDGAVFDRSTLLSSVTIDANTSMDEVFDRLSVYVNGQRMIHDYWDSDATAMFARDFEVKVVNSDGTISSANPGGSARSGAGKLLIAFHFALETGDQILIDLK